MAKKCPKFAHEDGHNGISKNQTYPLQHICLFYRQPISGDLDYYYHAKLMIFLPST